MNTVLQTKSYIRLAGTLMMILTSIVWLAPHAAFALSFTDCALQGGSCDASNTCVKYETGREGGLQPIVLGSCEVGGGNGGPIGGGGGGGGGGPSPRLHVTYKTATARGKTANFDSLFNSAMLNLSREDCNGQFTLTVKFDLVDSKRCCFDDRSFVKAGSKSTLKVLGYDFYDNKTGGSTEAVLQGPADGAKGTITVRVFGKGTGFQDAYTQDGSVRIVCQ
jgi:hypothetical protein